MAVFATTDTANGGRNGEGIKGVFAPNKKTNSKIKFVFLFG
jgi:hypothetical protein